MARGVVVKKYPATPKPAIPTVTTKIGHNGPSLTASAMSATERRELSFTTPNPTNQENPASKQATMGASCMATRGTTSAPP
jgi:hypothetical protein